jgi:hypothetical protein
MRDAGSADYKIDDAVLKNPEISEIVRAALVYERADYGHEPWKKTHIALSTQEFIAALTAAPRESVVKE